MKWKKSLSDHKGHTHLRHIVNGTPANPLDGSIAQNNFNNSFNCSRREHVAKKYHKFLWNDGTDEAD